MSTLIETKSNSWRPIDGGLYTQRRYKKRKNPIVLNASLQELGPFLDLGDNEEDWAEKVVDCFSKASPDALKVEIAYAAALAEATKREPAPQPINPETPPALRALKKAGKAIVSAMRQGRGKIQGPRNLQEAVQKMVALYPNNSLPSLLYAAAICHVFDAFVDNIPTGKKVGILKQAYPLNKHYGREDIHLSFDALKTIGRLCTAASIHGFTVSTALRIGQGSNNQIVEEYIHRYITQAAMDDAGSKPRKKRLVKRYRKPQEALPH